MSASEHALPQHSRVFISYSHDSAAHSDRVLALAQQLRRDGIDAELDQFHQEELLHWPRWCEEQLRPEKSDFVLCICTVEYKRRIEGKVPADVGKGVFWEGTLIYNYLYDAKESKRFLPVLLDKNAQDVPSIFGGYTRFELDVFGLENLQSAYSKLYRLLTRQPSRLMTEVGALHKLPALPEQERRTDFVKLTEQVLAEIREIRGDTSKILAILENRVPPASHPERPHKSVRATYRVFISYSHDSPEHQQRVLAWAERLRKDGVDAQLDRYVPGTPEGGWPRWMLDKLDWADFVLVVCTETYYKRFRGHEDPGKGKGVDWEGNLITSEIYNTKSKTAKFAPIFFESQDERFIPEPLRATTHYLLDSEDNYTKLYAFLTGQAGVTPGELGSLKTQAREAVEPLTFPAPPVRQKPERPSTPEPPVIPVDISQIGQYAPANLIGRKSEIETLLSAWNQAVRGDADRPFVLTITGMGGAGKSSLVAKWVALLAQRRWPGCEGVLGWSFYSQGTREAASVSADRFLKYALAFFSDSVMAGSPEKPDVKGRRLAELIGQQRVLLILDGLEPLQYPLTVSKAGQLTDKGLAALLQSLAADNRGLCVVTTRISVQDLTTFLGTTVREDALTGLSKDAGAMLLRKLGVVGDDVPMQELVDEVQGHALTLTLLGSFLKRAYQGDIKKRDRVKLEKADSIVQGGHAFRTMEAYEQWLLQGGEGKREVAILRLMGLFDRPADASSIKVLCSEIIPELNEPLVGQSEEDWSISLSKLEESHLLTVNRAESGEIISVDAHPLLREYFARKIRAETSARAEELLSKADRESGRVRASSRDTLPMVTAPTYEKSEISQAANVELPVLNPAVVQMAPLTRSSVERREYGDAKTAAANVLDLQLDFERKLATYRIKGNFRESFGPLENLDFKNLNQLVVISRAIGQTNTPLWKDLFHNVGERLQEELFRKNYFLSRDYHRAVGSIDSPENLQIRFLVDRTAHPLAFEALVDEDGCHIMLQSPIYRVLDARVPLREHTISQKRCLIVIADTAGIVPGLSEEYLLRPLRMLDEEGRWLERYLHNREVFVERLGGEGRKAAERANLIAMLGDGPWDMVHFAGHTYEEERGRGGGLILRGKAGPEVLQTEGFAIGLREARTRFVYLSRSSTSELAFQLARYGVPAALGFRWDIPDDIQLDQVRLFYEQLFAKSNVLQLAVLRARQELYSRYPDERIWASSVLINQASAAGSPV
jgi:hypothetical protein